MKTSPAKYAAIQRWRKNHPEKVLAYAQRWRTSESGRLIMNAAARRSRARRREFMTWLKEQPCLDCGNSYPAICMDFDHREPAQKVEAVSVMFNRSCSLDEIQAEIMKCDLLCANCHRLRTYRQMKREPRTPQGDD